MKIADDWYIAHDEQLCMKKVSNESTAADAEPNFLHVQIKSEELNIFDYESNEVEGSDDGNMDDCSSVGECTTDTAKLYHMKAEVSTHPNTAPAHCGREKTMCAICGQTFSTTGNMRKHMNAIHLEKKHECDICGRCFNQAYRLKEHLYSHAGVKPHKCEICAKAFARRELVRAHMRTHTGEKPFKCDIEQCERAYGYQIDLRRHKYGAHGIYFKKYPCPICERIYPENKLLSKHMRLAHPEIDPNS